MLTNVLPRFVLGVAAMGLASCGHAIVPGTYTLVGARTAAPGCMGSPPSGPQGVATAVVSATDASGASTMTIQIGSGNPCVIALSASGTSAQIADAHGCDATIAPPFFPSGVGTLENSGNGLRFSVRWSMTGAGSNTMCWVDDVWLEATR